jgi:mono/diheme cytochrome c family protein
MRFLKITLTISALLLFIAACNETKNTNSANVNNANSTVNNSTNPQPTTTVDELASAKMTYNDKCARCHKEDGSGGKIDIDGKVLNSEDLTSEKMKKMDDAKYIKYIENGIPDEGMPAFKDKLTDEQIKDVVKYIRAEFQSK